MAIPEHLQRLVLGGVNELNVWRDAEPDVIPDLSGADLRDFDLRGANLQDANLEQTILRSAHLIGADLQRARLTRSDMRGAVLDVARLHDAELDRTVLLAASLQDATMFGGSLSRASLEGCNATQAKFIDTILARSKFDGSTLEGAAFQSCDCKDSSFVNAEMRRSNLSESDFRDADLRAAKLHESNLEGSDLRRCVMDGASLAGALLTNADLRWADLRDADVSKANLRYADLRGAQNLTCEQLTAARNWHMAFRDETLACGRPIPGPPDDVKADIGAKVDIGADTVIDGITIDRRSQWDEQVPENERRQQVERSKRALVELETALSEAQAHGLHGQIGHNQPPEAIPSELLLNQRIAEVRAGIELLAAPIPDREFFVGLRRNLSRFREWLQPRIDAAADSAAPAIGATGGRVVVFGAALVVAKLTGAIDQLELLIRMLH